MFLSRSLATAEEPSLLRLVRRASRRLNSLPEPPWKPPKPSPLAKGQVGRRRRHPNRRFRPPDRASCRSAGANDQLFIIEVLSPMSERCYHAALSRKVLRPIDEKRLNSQGRHWPLPLAAPQAWHLQVHPRGPHPEERHEIEEAAAREDISVSQFMAEASVRA